MYDIEREAYSLYRIFGNQALVELNVQRDRYICRKTAMRLRDDYKEKSDREDKFDSSKFGRIFNTVLNRPIYRKYWFEAFDLMLAHMNIMGVNSLNSVQFSEVVFDKGIYEKYFKENFIEYAKIQKELLYYDEMTKEAKMIYERKRIEQREKLIPKYGKLPNLEEQSENE